MQTRSLRVQIVLAVVFASAAPCAGAQNAPESTANFTVLETTIADIQAAFRSGQLTCHALVDRYLKRITAFDQAGPKLNAVQTVNPNALAEADRLDATFKASGATGPLHCIPVLLKDEVETSDMPTTYGSAVFKNFVSKRDATIVTKLKRAGAIIIAKSNMGEFARGYVGSSFGIIRNPYDPKRNPAGSSGGTAAGIAANYATVGIGEDTGGSIRGPAAFGGLVGLRPTVPLVSRFGMMPARPAQDTLGPVARTVRDAAVLLDAIAGYDPNDPITAYNVGQIPPTYTAALASDGLKGAGLGVIREPQDPAADPSSDDYKKVKAVIDKAIADMNHFGAEIVDPVTIPNLKERVKRIYDDNIYETEEATDKYLADHPNAPVKTLREILMTGKVVPWRARTLFDNVGHSTAEIGYLRVLAAKEETRQLILKIMADNRLDALVYASYDHQPTVILEDVLQNPNTKDETGKGRNQYLAPPLGLPALTVPAGLTSDGFPVGLEFMGRAFSETTLLKLGYAYEQGTHNRKPPASTPALLGEP